MSHPTYPGTPAPYGGGPSYASPPPRRRRTGQVVAIVGLGVVALLGFVAAGVIFVTGPEDPAPSPAAADPPSPSGASEPAQDGESEATGSEAGPGTTNAGETGLAALGEAYADALNSKDEAAATALTCTQNEVGFLFDLVVGESDEFVAQQPEVDSGRGTGSVEITYPESVAPYQLLAYYEDGRWCTDLY